MLQSRRGRRPRVKLITIPWELEVPTLSLASLAAVTPPHFDVAIVDLLRERLFLDEEVDLVGISASTPSIYAAYALADLYRARGATVVLGGHHGTALPEEALAHVDAVVQGEGEVSWARICEDFLGNPARVQGVYADPPPDLSKLPQPRVDLMKWDRYGPFSYPIIASRGCPEACSFCFAKRMTRGFRNYPIAHVLEQVRRRPASARALYFVDDNLPGDPDHARELFHALARLKVPFGMQSRHEFCQDPANLALAREAGCALVSGGYESVNQATLDGTGKNARAEDYRRVSANIMAAGMIPSGNWMFGFDWDTPQVFAELLDFLDRASLLHCSFTTEIPFPGTPAFKKYQREGRLLTEDYDRYRGKDSVVVRPLGMTPEQLRDGVRWIAKKFYSLGRANRRMKLLAQHGWFAKGSKAPLPGPTMVALNYFQTLQWNYRSIPSLKWLYQRVEAANKYRYVGDWVRRSNFVSGRAPWRHDPAPAGAAELVDPRERNPSVRRGGARAGSAAPASGHPTGP